MRFLVDTNVFLHAANSASTFHDPARRFFEQHLRLRTPWCFTWPIVYEFLRVATHSRVFPKPLKASQALAFIGHFLEIEEVAILAPTDRHFALLNQVAGELVQPAGNLFHDLHTATLMREHGVREIITADTDFLQFRFLTVTNPLQ